MAEAKPPVLRAPDVEARNTTIYPPFYAAALKGAQYPYDTTTFIKISIQEVVKTLIEAIILVFLVMLLND